MMQHGAASAKPTVVYSNAPWIQGLNLGTLTRAEREARTELRTTRPTLNQM